MFRSSTLLGLFAGWLFSQVASWAQQDEGEVKTAEVVAARDAVIYVEDASSGVDRANGKGESLLIGNVQSSFTRRALIAFELGEVVPLGSVIVDARLNLGPLGNSFSSFAAIFRVFSPWAAGVTDPDDELVGGTPETGDVTWNYRFYNSGETARRQPWQQPGGDFSFDQPLASGIGEANGNRLSFTSEALVADVQQMLLQPDQHHGWILLGDESSFLANALQVASRENEDASLRPTLEVWYTEPRDVDKVIANYGILETVAGRGEDDGRDNHWKSRYEGGAALEAELSRPSTAVAAADGTIYFTDTYGHAVRRVSTEGLIETVAGTGVEGFNLDEGAALEVQLDQPNGLAVMPDGNLYILDIDNRRVCKVTPEGSLTTVFRDDTEPPFLTGRGLWVSEDEETVVYASRTALKRWTRAEGTIEVLATGFERLTNIGLDVSTGDFLGADVDDGTVWRIDPEAKTRQRIAGGGRFATSGVEAREARLEGVRGLAVSEHGGYFVTTEDGGDVWYVDTSGVAHVLMVGSGSGNVRDGDGQTLEELVGSDKNIVSQPYSITIAPNGDLVLITNETGFIRVVRKGRAPQIVGMGFGEEGAFGINWTSEPRRLYLVEGSEDLSTWDLLSEVASNSNTTLFFDTQSVDLAKRHYRVRLFYP